MEKFRCYLHILIAKIRIRYNYRLQFRILRHALRLGLKVGGDKNNGLTWDDANLFGKIVIVLLAKNLHRLQSVLILCKNGFAKDAIPLIRIMFEELVDFKYMHADKQKIEDYFAYNIHIRLKLGCTLLKSGHKSIDTEKIQMKYQELQNEWDKVKSKFTNNTGKVYQRWTCKTVADVSNKVGLGEAYQYIFGYLSNYIHSNPMSANDYVLGRDGEDVVTEIGSSQQFVGEVLSSASCYFVEMLNTVNDEYQMKLDDDLKGLMDKMKT